MGRTASCARLVIASLLLSAWPLTALASKMDGVLIFDGDSIAEGAGASPGHGLQDNVVADLAWRGRVYNWSQSGRPMAVCLQRFEANVASLDVAPRTPVMVVLHAGDNDIAGGATAAQAYDALTGYVEIAHRRGWVVITTTELTRPDFRAAKKRQLALYNQMIRANLAKADAIVDYDNLPRFNDLANRGDRTLFYKDGIHPSEGGYALLGKATAEVMRTLGNTSATPKGPER